MFEGVELLVIFVDGFIFEVFKVEFNGLIEVCVGDMNGWFNFMV